MESTLTLSKEQIAFYHQNGFLALENFVPVSEIDRIREAYDRIFAERAGREEGNQFDLAGTDEEGKQAALPQILGPSRYAPELAQGLFRVNGLAIAKQLLGEDAILMGDHAIFKPAHYGSVTPWHQDEAYWNPMMDYNSFSLWMPLQEATIENGCLQFIPKSHRLEVLAHHSIGHDTRIHGLEVEGADVTDAVPCPLPTGGCTIHHNRTLHYAGPNHTEIPRRALIIGYGVPPTPRSSNRRFPWNDAKQTPREDRARTAAEQAGKVI